MYHFQWEVPQSWRGVLQILSTSGPERETPGDGGLVRLVLTRGGRGLVPSLQPGLGMEYEQDSTFMVVGL